jgi:hypothetical protein
VLVRAMSRATRMHILCTSTVIYCLMVGMRQNTESPSKMRDDAALEMMDLTPSTGPKSLHDK